MDTNLPDSFLNLWIERYGGLQSNNEIEITLGNLLNIDEHLHWIDSVKEILNEISPRDAVDSLCSLSTVFAEQNEILEFDELLVVVLDRFYPLTQTADISASSHSVYSLICANEHKKDIPPVSIDCANMLSISTLGIAFDS
jgi:hypothetical protein